MSRIVEETEIPAGQGQLRRGVRGKGPKGYLERVAKYVPAEIIACYVTANGFAEHAPKRVAVLGIVFVVCLILTPLYVLQWTKKRRERIANSGVAVVAFLAWSYAYGGIFRDLGWYDASWASIVLVLITAISGAIVPIVVVPPPGPKLQEPKTQSEA